jgi:hypothetical protein
MTIPSRGFPYHASSPPVFKEQAFHKHMEVPTASARQFVKGWCQTNSNQSPLFANEHVLGDEKVPPFAKRGVSFLFEPDSGVDVPFEVKVIVH